LTGNNAFKEALASGRPATAMWVTVPWPPMLEILGACNLDAALIDMEHASCTIETVQNMIVAAELGGVAPLVRPPGIDPGLITRLLDAGAAGIVFPLVEDRAAAEKAVASTRFAPRGLRGWGGPHVRRARWQGTPAVHSLRQRTADERGVSSAAFVQKSEDDVSVVVLVETPRGVDNIQEIAEVEGIDAVIFGWGDFSVAVEFDFEQCRAAAWRVYESCKAAGVGVSISLDQVGPTDFYPGCFYVAGVDALIMSAALRTAIDATKDTYPKASRARGSSTLPESTLDV
jgi:2-keto-3-deoxy-L-rhamnonate aldolase RhmA